MKDSFAEKVLKGVRVREEMVSDKIAIDFKGLKPFDQVPMSPQERIREFDEITPEELANLRQTVGDEAMVDWAQDINLLRGGM